MTFFLSRPVHSLSRAAFRFVAVIREGMKSQCALEPHIICTVSEV